MLSVLFRTAPFGHWTGCQWTTVATLAHLDLEGLRSDQLPHPNAVADDITRAVRRLVQEGRIDPSDLSRTALFLVSQGLRGLASAVVSGLADTDLPPTTLPDLVQDARHALDQSQAYLSVVESDAACAEKWAREAIDAIKAGRDRQAQELLSAIQTIEASYEPTPPVWGAWVERVTRILMMPPTCVDTIAVNAELVAAT